MLNNLSFLFLKKGKFILLVINLVLFFTLPFHAFAYIKEFFIPDGINDFPIRTTQIGSTAVECYTGSNHSLEWIVNQYGNEPQYSLCLDTNNQPFDQECASANWAKETLTMRVCWWSNLKKFHMTTNSNNFSHHGCRTNPNEPGGFGAQLLLDITKRSDWPNPKYYLGNLEKLILEVDYSTEFFTHFGGCQPPCDPVTNTCQPIAFANIDVITSEFNPQNNQWKATQFYSVSLYDNREELRIPTAEFLDCQLPTTSGAGTWVNAGQPVSYFGLPFALPGEGIKHYEIDVLPRIKYYIQRCYQQENWGTVNFNNFRVDSFFMHQETYNTALLSNNYINPKIKFVIKNDLFKNFLREYHSLPTINKDLNNDSKINLVDFAKLL